MTDRSESSKIARAPSVSQPAGKWRLQFSLRTLLIAVALCALLIGLPSHWWQQIRRERAIVEQLGLKGATVRYLDRGTATSTTAEPKPSSVDWMSTPPGWFCKLVGNADFKKPKLVTLMKPNEEVLDHIVFHIDMSPLTNTNSPVGSDLIAVWQLNNVEKLRVIKIDGVKPQHFRGIKHLQNLDRLELYGCGLDLIAIIEIASLSRLQSLTLKGCDISNDAWAALNRMPELETLALDGSSITDDGLEALGQLDQLKTITVED